MAVSGGELVHLAAIYETRHQPQNAHTTPQHQGLAPIPLFNFNFKLRFFFAKRAGEVE